MKNAGFTLVELLVTITIFVILTGVVLFSQSRFNSTIFLTNLAYDTALTIRQAQTFGINIKEFNGNTFLPYGVHFDTASPQSFILFADTSYRDVTSPGDGQYLFNNGSRDNSIFLSECQNTKGCVARYNITKGNYINKICSEDLDVSRTDCSPGKSSEAVDIVFIRPSPDAIIRFGGSTSDPAGAVTIILSGADGQKKKVKVLSTGLIEVSY